MEETIAVVWQYLATWLLLPSREDALKFVFFMLIGAILVYNPTQKSGNGVRATILENIARLSDKANRKQLQQIEDLNQNARDCKGVLEKFSRKVEHLQNKIGRRDATVKSLGWALQAKKKTHSTARNHFERRLQALHDERDDFKNQLRDKSVELQHCQQGQYKSQATHEIKEANLKLRTSNEALEKEIADLGDQLKFYQENAETIAQSIAENINVEIVQKLRDSNDELLKMNGERVRDIERLEQEKINIQSRLTLISASFKSPTERHDLLMKIRSLEKEVQDLQAKLKKCVEGERRRDDNANSDQTEIKWLRKRNDVLLSRLADCEEHRKKLQEQGPSPSVERPEFPSEEPEGPPDGSSPAQNDPDQTDEGPTDPSTGGYEEAPVAPAEEPQQTRNEDGPQSKVGQDLSVDENGTSGEKHTSQVDLPEDPATVPEIEKPAPVFTDEHPTIIEPTTSKNPAESPAPSAKVGVSHPSPVATAGISEEVPDTHETGSNAPSQDTTQDEPKSPVRNADMETKANGNTKDISQETVDGDVSPTSGTISQTVPMDVWPQTDVQPAGPVQMPYPSSIGPVNVEMSDVPSPFGAYSPPSSPSPYVPRPVSSPPTTTQQRSRPPLNISLGPDAYTGAIQRARAEFAKSHSISPEERMRDLVNRHQPRMDTPRTPVSKRTPSRQIEFVKRSYSTDDVLDTLTPTEADKYETGHMPDFRSHRKRDSDAIAREEAELGEPIRANPKDHVDRSPEAQRKQHLERHLRVQLTRRAHLMNLQEILEWRAERFVDREPESMRVARETLQDELEETTFFILGVLRQHNEAHPNEQLSIDDLYVEYRPVSREASFISAMGNPQGKIRDKVAIMRLMQKEAGQLARGKQWHSNWKGVA